MPRKAKGVTDLKSLARQHTEKAIATLAGVMDQPKASPATRVAAAEALLSRGWGKAVQRTDINIVVHYLSRLSLTISTLTVPLISCLLFVG